jgi:hypothetical protein
MSAGTRITLAGLLLGAVLAGGVAWATIPGSDSTIHGCYKQTSGDLRVVDKAGDCKNNEIAISWSDHGTAGATGPVGPSGPPGAQGATGATGPAGANGTNGTNGAVGAKGDPCLSSDPACVGPRGPTGPAGADGTNGTNGIDGLNGAPGKQGDPCLPEIRGCQGPTGETGPKGDTGDPGTNGTDGTAGATGPQGPPGSSLTGTRTGTTLPRQPLGGGPTTFVPVSTSLDFGTLTASCRVGDQPPDAESNVYITDTTAGGSRLYLAAGPSNAVGTSLAAGVAVHLGQARLSPTPQFDHFASYFTVMRFTTNPDGSSYFSSEHIAFGFEELADGSCRVSTSITNDQ